MRISILDELYEIRLNSKKADDYFIKKNYSTAFELAINVVKQIDFINPMINDKNINKELSDVKESMLQLCQQCNSVRRIGKSKNDFTF